MIKLFKQNFDDKFNKLLNSMVEIAFEYVNWDKEEVEIVYVYGNLEDDSYTFDCFYKINGLYSEKHELNKYSKNKSIDTSVDMQDKVLETGIDDLTKLKKLFQSDKREVPSQIKLIYSTKSGAFDSKFEYGSIISGTDKLPDDIVSEWIAELSKGN